MQNYIDLNMIEYNLKSGQYYGSFSFIQDVRKLWYNALKYFAESAELKAKFEIAKAQFEKDINEMGKDQIEEIIF